MIKLVTTLKQIQTREFSRKNGSLLKHFLKVSLARPSCDMIKGANLYVSGLLKTMTQRELESMFAPCGNIITSRILCDPQTGEILNCSISFHLVLSLVCNLRCKENTGGIVNPVRSRLLTSQFLPFNFRCVCVCVCGARVHVSCVCMHVYVHM